MGPNKFQDVTVILFDLDNTLINTKGADRLACEQVFRHLQDCGVRGPSAREAVDKFYGLVRDSPQDPCDEDGDVDAWRLLLWRQALGPGLSGRAPAAYALWREARARHLGLGPELEDLLLGLRRRYKLGLVTNGPSSAQWDKLRRVGAPALFDAIVVSGDVRSAKPSPAIFEEAFRRLDASPLECAMVGDRLDTDIRGAAGANCAATVWVSDSRAPLDQLQPRPDFRVRHVREILDLLPEEDPGGGFSSLCRSRALGLFHSLRDEAPPRWRRDR